MINDGEKSERNAKPVVLFVDNDPKICFFALRDITYGEQITYDYCVPDLPWRKVCVPLFYHYDLLIDLKFLFYFAASRFVRQIQILVKRIIHPSPGFRTFLASSSCMSLVILSHPNVGQKYVKNLSPS